MCMWCISIGVEGGGVHMVCMWGVDVCMRCGGVHMWCGGVCMWTNTCNYKPINQVLW